MFSPPYNAVFHRHGAVFTAMQYRAALKGLALQVWGLLEP